MVSGETPGTALGGCPHHIWRPLIVNLPCGSILIYRIHQAWWDTDANHPALLLWGQNRGGGAGGGGDPHGAAGTSTFHPVSPWSSPPEALCAQTGLHSSCCNTEGLAPHHHSGIHGPCKPLLREPKPGAGQGHSAFLGEGQGEAPGSLQRVFCTIFLSHCWSCPNQAQWVWSLALSGSSITSMQRSTVPHEIPRAGWQQQCCRLVTQLLGKVPSVPVALHREGMASRGNGTCSRRERC